MSIVPPPSIKTVAVIGAGQMGAGIAQVSAQSGFETLLYDLSADMLQKARAGMEKSLTKLHEKGRLSEEPSAVLGRLRTVGELGELAGADLVVEAIVENQGVKEGLFRELGKICHPGAILASNTSSIPITALGTASGRPSQFIGMHFMNPVPLMQLVEVIRGYSTSDDTAQAVRAVAEAMGKTPVECNDYPGFVSNRILMPMLNEAIGCVMEGVAEPEAIDQIMKLGMNHPMGPLALADFIGLDTCLSIMEVLHEGLGDDKYRPSPLLRKMVQAGLLGKKSGEGFYRY